MSSSSGTPETASHRDVIAAGAVVLRRGPDGRREVLLVHRPRYDDWSFPKGKRDRGEHVLACAVREVEEEAGVRIVLGRPLEDQRYRLANGRMKTVHYWVARLRDGTETTFEPNDEVDEIRWLRWEEAAEQLTHDHDRLTLAQARERRSATRTVLVLRHAQARGRGDWQRSEPGAADSERPLDPTGTLQAERLTPLLDAYAPHRLITSPALRCAATVAPYAAHAELTPRLAAGLAEERPGDVAPPDRERVAGWAKAHGRILLCSHRPVLPAIVAALGIDDPGPRLEPAELLVAHLRGGAPVAVERHRLD